MVKTVAGQCEVYLDGGVRTGTDVLKALALGARAVFVGQAAAWGLACNVGFFVFFCIVLFSSVIIQSLH